MILLTGCEKTSLTDANAQSPAIIQSEIELKAAKTPIVTNVATTANKDSKEKQSSKPDAFECVRAKPEPIIRKSVFPKTNFRLEKNKDFPFQDIGFETVYFSNGDKLIIENSGCENYTLIFRFETGRSAGSQNSVRFWYERAVSLMNQTKKGIRSTDLRLINDGIKALNSYMKSNKTLKYEEYRCLGESEIDECVALEKLKRLKSGKYQIGITFGIGPL